VPKEKGLIARGVEEVVDRLHGLAADLEALVAMTSAAGDVAVGHALVKAAFALAFPPFAGLMAGVACLGEDVADGRRAAEDVDHAVAVGLVAHFAVGVVAGDAVLVRIQA